MGTIILTITHIGPEKGRFFREQEPFGLWKIRVLGLWFRDDEAPVAAPGEEERGCGEDLFQSEARPSQRRGPNLVA